MRKRLMCVCALVAGASLTGLFGTSSAQATIETFHAIPGIPSTTTDWSSSLPFPQFNPALGTLQSVELILNGGLSTQITVKNNDTTSSSNGNVKTEVQITAQDAGNNLTIPELDILSSPAFTYSLAAGASITSGVLTNNGNSDITYIAAPVLTEFTGVGTYSLPAFTFTQTDLSNTGGNTSANQATTAFLAGTVVYTYNSVPEPASLGLVFGLLPLLAARRRRNA